MRKSFALLTLPLAAVGIAVVPLGASAAPHSPKLTGGIEHIYLGSTCANCQNLSLIATGAVTDYGHTTTPGVDLRKGTWKVNTSGLKQALISQNLTDCWYRYGEKGPAIITGGTGAYRGITGKIIVSLAFTAVGTKLANGTCNQADNAPNAATIAYGSGVGTVKF